VSNFLSLEFGDSYITHFEERTEKLIENLKSYGGDPETINRMSYILRRMNEKYQDAHGGYYGLIKSFIEMGLGTA
jgi:hypothetical protein